MWVGMGGWGDATVYVPFYAGITRVPKAYTIGIKTKFNWDSAYWIFNLLGNWARLHYTHMIKEIKKVQQSLEGAELRRLEGIDEEAWSLYKENPDSAIEFLNIYCAENVNEILRRWRELTSHLIVWYSHNWYK